MKYASNALLFLSLTTGVLRLAAADTGTQLPSVRAQGLREQMRALQFEQQAMLQRDHQIQAPEQQAHEGNTDPVLPQTQVPASGQDEVSKNGRMSLEERRALRRQIDEAGHQIYAPPH